MYRIVLYHYFFRYLLLRWYSIWDLTMYYAAVMAVKLVLFLAGCRMPPCRLFGRWLTQLDNWTGGGHGWIFQGPDVCTHRWRRLHSCDVFCDASISGIILSTAFAPTALSGESMYVHTLLYSTTPSLGAIRKEKPKARTIATDGARQSNRIG